MRWDVERGFLAERHQHHSFVPAFDHFADTDGETERPILVDAGVELLATS